LIDTARPARHATGDRWSVDETYVKIAGRWTYLYRAIDQHGHVIDVLVSERRNGRAARTFFNRALTCGPSPVEVTTDRAPVYPRVIDDLVPAARQVLERHANNTVEADHSRLKARLRPMRTEDDPLTAHDRGRARLRAKPAPPPLRTDRRRARPRSGPGGVHRPRAIPMAVTIGSAGLQRCPRPINATPPISLPPAVEWSVVAL
jgi:hypothetical protein